MTKFLKENLELISYSSGYTVQNFCKMLRVSRNVGRHNPYTFSKVYGDKIKQFILAQDEAWLTDLLEKCQTNILNKLEGCVFSDVEEPGAFRRNISAIVYFLDISWVNLAKHLGVAPSTLNRMRNFPELYDEKRWEEIYVILVNCYAKTPCQQQFLRKASKYIILNKIPKNAFNAPRKKNMFYNET